jgi:hypothetical protein
MTDDRLKCLERELELVKQRNARVETDKAWEGSAFRINAICVLTYIVATVFLYLIGVQRFWLSALIPTIGFYLSAQSLPAIKKWWIEAHFPSQKH